VALLALAAAAPAVSQSQPTTLGFFTVTPCRVADTRNAVGPWGGPAISANTSRSFTIVGRCGVPTSADAVAVSFAAVGATAAGGLRFYAAGTALPATTSLQYPASKARSGNGQFGLGYGGALAVHADQASGSVHVVLDITGYFETGAATPPPPPSGTGAHIWSKDFGGPNLSASAVALGVAVDSLGEIAIAGYMQGSVDMGTGLMTSAGGNDIFIAKYTAGGVPLWSRRVGASQDDRAQGIAVDGSGNVYVIGTFQGTVDFGGGAVSSPATYVNSFLVKYSPLGAHLWSKRLSSTGMDEGLAVAVDGSGNVTAAGVLYQTSNFGGSSLATAGGSDVWVARFSSAGAHVWSRRAGGTGDDWVYAVAVDGSGNASITGYSAAAADFGGGLLNGFGAKDIIVAQYSSTGGHVWSRRVGGSGNDVGRDIAVDGSGNVVVTGNFASSSVNFGSGALSNAGGADIFLVKYSSQGASLWSRQFGSSLSLSEGANSVATDAAGNVMLTGSVAAPIDFGGGVLTGDNYYDIYVAKFDGAGAHAWSKRTGEGSGTGIAADGSGNVVVTGTFTGVTPVNFGGSDLQSPGATDTFLVKFGP
jgi:hypothetical protein